MAKQILFTFTAQDVGVALKMDAIKDRQKAINAEIKEAKRIGSPYTKLLGESEALKRQTKDLRQEQNQLNKAFKATTVPKDSLAGLRLEYDRLVVSISKLSQEQRKSQFGQRLIKEAATAKTAINSMEQAVGRFTGNVGNYKKGLLSIGDLVTGGVLTGGIFALAQGIGRLGSQVVAVNAEVSDSIADVAKTANISIEAVNRLSDLLEKRDTRTSLVDQLGIAEIGGRLGVAEQDLFGFVEAIDVVNVALGDQFGGGVEQTTDVLGKLRNVLLDIKTDNIGEDIVHIGNALNYLEAQGVASAGSIAEFAGRIGGIAQPLGISSGKILGVSTTLAELNINAERGATAFVKLLQQVSVAPEKFAQVAGVSADEFKKLVNEDIFGAVELFLSKLNDKNLSNTALTSTLKDLGLSGVRVTEVVAKLGGNLDLLRTRVGESTKTLRESSSVTQEFEKKNVTLGAQIEKLTNSFNNLFTSSAFGRGFGSLVGGIGDFINEIADASDKLFDWTAASTGAETANDILTASYFQLNKEIDDNTAATERNFNILRNGQATAEQRKQAISDLVKLYPDLLTQQQLEAANITQLNGLQELSTNVLRAQITERLKLRAKESIETQIIERKLRKVELDATPDRRLLGALTAGETIRGGNFGVTDPAKLRANLNRDFANDIAELEAASRKVDQQFNRLKVSAEDNLTAAEQDALDLFRQFNEGGKAAGESLKTVGNEADSLGDKVGGGKGKGKKASLAGSLDAAKEALEKLNKQIAATPLGDPKLAGLIDQAKEAEKQVDLLQRRLDELRNPSTGATQAQRLAELGGVDTTATDNQRRRELAAVGLGGQIIGKPEEITAEKERQAAINLKLDQKEFADRRNELELQADHEEAVRDALEQGAITSAQNISNAVFEIKRNQLQKEQDLKLAALDKEEAEAIKKAGGNAKKEALIRKQFEARRLELEKQGAKERKELARKEALINIALSITKAYTGAPPPFNFILAGVAAIAGAAQLAAINAQEFAFGGQAKRLKPGIVNEKQNAPRTAHGDTVLAYLKPGEMMLNEQQQIRLQRLAGPNIFQLAGVPGVGKGSATVVPHFASGGVAEFTPQTTFATANNGTLALNAKATFSAEERQQLASSLAIVIARTVASEVRTALALGLDDANRNLERQQELESNRKG